MHRIHFLMAVAIVALALVSDSVAVAADFTFNVPVAFHKIPSDIETFFINVAIYDATWDQEHPAVGDHLVGYAASSNITIQNGEYVGTVTVPVNASYDLRKRPEEAVYYEVYFAMQGPPGYSGGCLAAMDPDGAYPYDPSQPRLCEYVGKIYEPKTVPKLTPLRKLTR